MVKRNVLQFFVLLLAMTAILAVLHFVRFGGFTGFSVFDSQESEFGSGVVFVALFIASLVIVFVVVEVEKFAKK